MPIDAEFIGDVQHRVDDGGDWNGALACIVRRFGAEAGTIHLLGESGALHLTAATPGIPAAVLDAVRIVPVGKGMAGLAVERNEVVTTCNIQTDVSGDVRAGARATGLKGSIVVPIVRSDSAVRALGIANREERTFTPSETELLTAIGRVLGARAGLS